MMSILTSRKDFVIKNIIIIVKIAKFLCCLKKELRKGYKVNYLYFYMPFNYYEE